MREKETKNRPRLSCVGGNVKFYMVTYKLYDITCRNGYTGLPYENGGI